MNCIFLLSFDGKIARIFSAGQKTARGEDMEQKTSNGWLESHRDSHANTTSAAFCTEVAALHFAEVMTAQMKKAGMTIPKLAAAMGVNDLGACKINCVSGQTRYNQPNREDQWPRKTNCSTI